MREFKYTQDGDALMVTLSDEPFDHAKQREGIIVHVSPSDDLVLLEISQRE